VHRRLPAAIDVRIVGGGELERMFNSGSLKTFKEMFRVRLLDPQGSPSKQRRCHSCSVPPNYAAQQMPSAECSFAITLVMLPQMSAWLGEFVQGVEHPFWGVRQREFRRGVGG
jgi:hypothetical protein